jgi:glycosyltransferase involved in cell wall biosynthesis
MSTGVRADPALRPRADRAGPGRVSAARVALLTNFIAPYRLPLFHRLAERVAALRIFVSTPMEANRSWPAQWEGLDVRVQRTLTIPRTWRHPQGFRERIYTHVPLDTPLALARWRPDVVISGEFGARTLGAAAYTALRRSCPLVIWATLSDHTEVGRSRVQQTVRRRLLRRAAAVVTNGSAGARYLRRMGAPESRIYRMPQTIDVAAFRGVARAGAPDPRRLLYVGQLAERKGLEPFVRTLAAWLNARPGERCELRIAGGEPDAELLAAAAAAPNLSVVPLGAVPYDRLPAVYAEAGVLVFPTLADEWGLVVNEALAAGVPVLGSAYSQAVEDLVEDGVTGWVFRPDDSADARRALDRALTSAPETLQRMSAAARARGAELTPELGAGLLVDVIEAVR